MSWWCTLTTRQPRGGPSQRPLSCPHQQFDCGCISRDRRFLRARNAWLPIFGAHAKVHQLKGVHAVTISLRRLVVMFASVVVLVLAFAPLSFAGGDDGCDDDSCSTSSSSSSGAAGSGSGGAPTGFGGAVVKPDGSIVIPLMLAGGSVVLLTAAGAAGRRARRVQQ